MLLQIVEILLLPTVVAVVGYFIIKHVKQPKSKWIVEEGVRRNDALDSVQLHNAKVMEMASN